MRAWTSNALGTQSSIGPTRYGPSASPFAMTGMPSASSRPFASRPSGIAGAVISASHNPAEYNGIKFFGETGYKLADAVEDEIEALTVDDDGPTPTGRGLGRIRQLDVAGERYLRHLDSVPGCSLQGMRVVVDC